MFSSYLGKMFIDLGMLQEGCYESSNNLYSCNEGKNLSLRNFFILFFGMLQTNRYVTGGIRARVETLGPVGIKTLLHIS